MIEGFKVEFKQDEYRELVALFETAPASISKYIKAGWMRQGKAAVALMRSISFSGTTSGPHSVGRLSDAKQPKDILHLQDTLAFKKIKFGGAKGGAPHFGGYMRMGFKGSRGQLRSSHPLANIFEFSKGAPRFQSARTITKLLSGKRRYTGRLKTSEPLGYAWAIARKTMDPAKSVSEAIDRWMNTKARGAGAAQADWMSL